jgi:hypothetical protein
MRLAHASDVHRGGIVGLLIGLALLSTGAVWAGTTDTDTAVVCQRAKLVRGEARRALARGAVVGVTADQEARLRRPRTVCLPAVAAGQTAPPLGVGLQSWQVRLARDDRRDGRYGETVALATELGTVAGELRSLTRLLAPVGIALGAGGAASPTASASLACHRLDGNGDGAALDLVTALGSWSLHVDAARAACLPSDGAAGPSWVCHRARLGRGAKAARGTLVSTSGAWGDAVLRLGPVSDVCVRARVAEPDARLRIEPAGREIEWRATGEFRAILTHGDGSAEDVTGRVSWSAADPSIAAPAENPPVAGSIFGREPGATTIVATDPVTGAAADASLRVTWTLERIAIEPQQVNRTVGQQQGFQATGFFASGASHNVTPRLTWASSDTTIAGPGASPSRMTALRFGTATISACDPLTGICAESDATMIVFGGLQSIEVFPQTIRAIEPGASVRFTAKGNYADGRERNLTQRVEWIVEEPGVAAAPNDAGDRSRVDGLVPGVAQIHARDPETGLRSFSYPLYVIGDLVGIDVHPIDANGDTIRGLGFRRYTAIGRFVGGGTKNVTQDVVWHSRDAAIAAAPNTPGDKSRIDAAGGSGTAAIYAEDPTTGIVSNDALFRVLGALTSLGLRPSPYRMPFPRNRVPVGGLLNYTVYGTFSTGETLNFGRFNPDGYTLVSSDPAIAEVVPPNQMRGVQVGTVMIHAVDLETGIESPPQELIVQGELARLLPHLYFDRLFVGGTSIMEVDGFFPPSIILPFRGPLVFASSDETVATVAPLPGPARDRVAVVTAVGPGTAKISATDPLTGVSSTPSGDDATVTVFPNTPPARIVVTPSVATIPVDGFEDFTAVAEYANGQTLNVTQDATWTIGDANVAETRSFLARGKSRTFGIGAGVTTIRASFRGVSSTASGNDATVFVSPVVAFAVYGTEPPLAVGEDRDIRVKVRLASGRELDVTNQLEYGSLDVGIADFPDDEVPNRVVAIAPGTAQLDLGFPDSTVRTSSTLTVVDPGSDPGSPSGAFLR